MDYNNNNNTETQQHQLEQQPQRRRLQQWLGLFHVAAVTAVAVLALAQLPATVNCGKFDLGNGPIPVRDAIPTEWTKKLDLLNMQSLMSSTLRMAKREFDMATRLEAYVQHTGIQVANESTAYSLLLDNLPSDSVLEFDKAGRMMQKVSSQFVYASCITNGVPIKYCAKYINLLTLPRDSNLSTTCSAIDSRSKDKAGQPYRRLIEANYNDGLEKMRKTKRNHQMPNARNISSHFYESAWQTANEIIAGAQFSPEGQLDQSRNIFFVQWSQFVEQDIVQTVQQRHDNGQAVQCCKNNQVANPRSLSSSCAPIHVSDKDPYYRRFVLNCLNYVRSAITVNPNCKLGPINQLNMASDIFDLSQVYGATNDTSSQLSLLIDGKLRIGTDALTANEPIAPNSGDPRAIYSPYMIVQHAMFQRSHNQIATQLKELNPNWTDAKLYDTARRINRAIFQKVTYEEWLPSVVGARLAARIRNNNEELIRDPAVRGVSNEFATAAIRFYNSMLPGDLYETSSGGGNGSNNIQKKLFELRDTFYHPRALNWTRDTTAKIVSSTLTQKAMALDTSYVDDLNVDLFRAKNYESHVFGTDSLALDIMRSRDHGLTGYVHYLNLCRHADRRSVVMLFTWADVEYMFSAKDFGVLRKLYHHVEDIDLIVGAIAERPEPDALVGPTLLCILGEQMDKSRRSDPQFYNVDSLLRDTVQNYSAAKLLCDTTELRSVQANVFQIPSPQGRNPIVRCDELSNGLNLQRWRDHV